MGHAMHGGQLRRIQRHNAKILAQVDWSLGIGWMEFEPRWIEHRWWGRTPAQRRANRLLGSPWTAKPMRKK